jgi:hypothetical protein
VLEAVEKVQARIEELRQAKADRQQLQLKFSDSVIAESPTGGGFPPFSLVRPPFGHQIITGSCGKLLKPNRGEVAERLNAAVC